ncbi:MAG: DUF4330 domain-containing protein, partial [Clostridia bacterium]|nr:DUF4330 domain-containing protein [Clostridia bacterium]
MMVDEKGRLFSKISIIDLVIVLLMVVAIAFVGVKILGLNDKIGAINVKTETYQITFKVNNVRQATVDALEKSVGEEVTDVWAASLGKLTKINSVTPVMTNIANDDGSFRQ